MPSVTTYKVLTSLYSIRHITSNLTFMSHVRLLQAQSRMPCVFSDTNVRQETTFWIALYAVQNQAI